MVNLCQVNYSWLNLEYIYIYIYEGLKQSQPLVPDTVFSEAAKGHWIQEVCGGPLGIRRQTVLHLSAYVNLRPLGLTWGKERYCFPFISTPRPLTRIGPSKRVFQRASGSPDQACLEPHCMYVECRPVCGPLAFDLFRASGEGPL